MPENEGLSLEQAQDNVKALLRDVIHNEMNRVIVDDDGKPAAVLIPWERYVQMLRDAAVIAEAEKTLDS